MTKIANAIGLLLLTFLLTCPALGQFVTSGKATITSQSYNQDGATPQRHITVRDDNGTHQYTETSYNEGRTVVLFGPGNKSCTTQHYDNGESSTTCQ